MAHRSTTKAEDKKTSSGIIELKLGDRVYEFIPCVNTDWSRMVYEQAERLGAIVTDDDRDFVRAHRNEIPVELRDTLYPVFIGKSKTGCLWMNSWRSAGNHFCALDRLVRRKR